MELSKITDAEASPTAMDQTVEGWSYRSVFSKDLTFVHIYDDNQSLGDLCGSL